MILSPSLLMPAKGDFSVLTPTRSVPLCPIVGEDTVGLFPSGSYVLSPAHPASMIDMAHANTHATTMTLNRFLTNSSVAYRVTRTPLTQRFPRLT